MKARIHLPVALTILIGLATAAAAQDIMDSRMPIADPGSASIAGRVMLPSGISNAGHLKIILSNTQAPLTTLYSDKNGEFHFDNLSAGTYFVQVFPDESQYESFSQQIRLKPGEPAYMVLSLKGKMGVPAKTERSKVVSVGEEERLVPAAARQAFEQAD